MPRPRQFEIDQVTAQAMELFWRQGYESTSIADLVEVMGINRASLYNTFGDKRGLFLAALQHYCENMTAPYLQALRDDPQPLVALRRFFEVSIEQAAHPSSCWGCLLVNSMVEFGDVGDGEIQVLLQEGFSQAEDTFDTLLTRAQRDGAFPADQPTRPMARYLLNCFQGILVTLRAQPDPERLRQVVDITLRAIDA